MVFTDIERKSWIELLPAAVRPYAYLVRLDRPIGIWLLLLPGWWAIVMAAGGVFRMNRYDWWIFVLFGIGAVIMRAAGCVINDIWDRKLDRHVGRTETRPLASGTLSVRQALAFLGILLLGGLAILLQMNMVTVLLGFLSVPLIILYPLMKRWIWWPQAFLGLTFNFGALMGWAAVTGAPGLPALLLYAGGIFWTLAYDTIYAHQDMEDDALTGIKSTARKFGAESKNWVGGFYMACVLFLALAFLSGFEGVLKTWPLIFPVFYGFILYKNWNPADQENCLNTFKANRNLGILVLLAVVLAAL